MPSPETIRELFSSIAPEYDRMNATFTFGMDAHQRRVVAKAIYKSGAKDILDLATGSGVLAFAIAKHYQRKGQSCQILALDFCPELLEVARENLPAQKLTLPQIAFVQGDALQTGLPDASFDAISIGFGLRNFASRPAAYDEILRLLRPGGCLYILETSQPVGIRRFFYKLWLPMIPLIARLSGSNPAAYKHLIDSTAAFPTATELTAELQGAGFTEITARPLMMGSLALHVAKKAL